MFFYCNFLIYYNESCKKIWYVAIVSRNFSIFAELKSRLIYSETKINFEKL